MVSLTELSNALGPHLVFHSGRQQPNRQLTGVHVSELEDPTPYLEGGELLLTTGMPLVRNDAAAGEYVARLRDKGILALGLGLGPWLEEVPVMVAEVCAAAGIDLLTVPDGVPFQNVSRAYWRLSARSGQADLMGSLGTQTALAQAAMRPDATTAVVRGLAQALGGWAAYLPADSGPSTFWPASAEGYIPPLRAETLRLNRSGTHSAATFEIHGQAVVEYSIGTSGRIHGFLAVGPGRTLTAADRQVILTVCTLLALKARQREVVSGASATLGAAVAKLVLHGHTEAARILAEDVGLQELPGRVRVLGLTVRGGENQGTLIRAASVLVPDAGLPPLPDYSATCLLRHEEESALYLVLPDSDMAAAGREPEPAGSTAAHPHLAGALSEPVPLGEAASVMPAVRRALRQAPPGSLVGTGSDSNTRAREWVKILQGHPRSDLVGTVTEYLRHRGHWENASRSLGVHRNSLRHRISLASSLLDADLDDPDVFAPLWMELRHYER
ncbi:PucR family transcriptional regulator ligand-binding domain-containing protein [Arthrobacter sp. APC 3897]|uniref:PucR family transcriptional regulator ligand-binding domain-containing protein n=1 Tax=Arthrobacter sp. APC 3897 TaxID=3035204 RepID=UPI0025B332AC|nr:PucR family transcriptional regulator ligand-binding domain-containing protein [Arthrobacter sp. APC 3897]MDN3482687.1 PucR family transcriptional regulator ligand-binding domain-containing protein [Arthrobacter sp. APC 3897]